MSKTLTTTWQTWCFVIFCLLTGKLKCQGSLVICQRSHVLVSHGEPVQNIPTPTGSSLTPRPGLRVSPPCRPSSCPHLPCAGHHPDPATLRTQEAHPQRHPWGRRAPSPRPPPPGRLAPPHVAGPSLAPHRPPAPGLAPALPPGARCARLGFAPPSRRPGPARGGRGPTPQPLPPASARRTPGPSLLSLPPTPAVALLIALDALSASQRPGLRSLASRLVLIPPHAQADHRSRPLTRAQHMPRGHAATWGHAATPPPFLVVFLDHVGGTEHISHPTPPSVHQPYAFSCSQQMPSTESETRTRPGQLSRSAPPGGCPAFSPPGTPLIIPGLTPSPGSERASPPDCVD